MGKKVVLIIIIAAVLIAAGTFSFFLFFDEPQKISSGSSASGSGSGKSQQSIIDNLTTEQIAEQFDEKFVYYLLSSMGASQLHNPVLSSNTPKMQIEVGDLLFNAEVSKGKIKVAKGDIENEDIIIRTSRIEAAKMLKDKNYVRESFTSGNSNAELVAGKAELFSKGYLSLYEKFS